MNPLDALKDIHAAPDPGIWPLAPGWWALLALLVLAGLLGVYLWRRYRRYCRQREVLHEFEAVYLRYQSNPDAGRLAAGLHRLVRRLMLASGAHQQLGLTGEAFLRFLDAGVDDAPFSNGVGRALVDAPYRPQADIDAEALYHTVMAWADRQVRALA